MIHDKLRYCLINGGNRLIKSTISKNLKFTELVYKNKRTYKTYLAEQVKTIPWYEKKDYDISLQKAKNENKRLYRERQAQIENEYIENFNEEQYKLMLKKEQKLRTKTIEFAYLTGQDIIKKKEEEERCQTQLKKFLVDQEIKHKNRKRILGLMDADQENWFNGDNIEERIMENVVIPENVLNQTDYYNKLQQQSMQAEQGDYEAIEDILYEKKGIRQRNSYLIPIFNQLVSYIRYLKHDEELILVKEYEVAKSLIYKKSKNDQDLEANQDKLDDLYNKLLIALHIELDTPSVSIKKMHYRLLLVYNLLKKWESYTEVLIMSQEEIQEKIDEGYDQTAINEDPLEKEREIKRRQKDDEFLSAEEKFTSEEDNSNKSIDDIHLEMKSALKKEFKTFQKDYALDNQKNQKHNLLSTDGSGLDQSSDIKSGDEAQTDIGEIDQKLDALVPDNLFDNIYEDAGGAKNKEFSEMQKKMDAEEKELESEWEQIEKMGDGILYGQDSSRKSILATEFLREQHIESFIPKKLIEDFHNYSQPKQEFDDVIFFDLKNRLMRLDRIMKLIKRLIIIF